MTLGLATFALVGAMTLYLMPVSFNTLRDVITQIRADFVANIVKEGQFDARSGITFHYREKSGDALLGIFMQDERNPEKIAVYIAERGRTVNVDNDSFLVLENGSVQQQERTAATPPSSRSSAMPSTCPCSRPTKRKRSIAPVNARPPR